MEECERYKATTLRNLIDAFNEGFQMGVEHGNNVFKGKCKIDVEYIESANELKFARLDDGTIMNYGRSLPF